VCHSITLRNSGGRPIDGGFRPTLLGNAAQATLSSENRDERPGQACSARVSPGFDFEAVFGTFLITDECLFLVRTYARTNKFARRVRKLSVRSH
jgi:hypothetical protein